MPTTTAFDSYAYLMRYPDVRKNWHKPAIDHWNQAGKAEGRIPGADVPDGEYTTSYSSDFNPDCYLSRYEDIRLNGIDPLQHWNKYGKTEGRIPGCTIYTKVPPKKETPTPASTTNNVSGTTVDNLVTPKAGPSTVTDTVAAVKDAATQAAAKVTTEAKKMPVGVWIGLGVLALVAVIVIAKK